MSLIQALLQDPVPMDVYIALRSDGAIGSGTENDPWNGGRANYPVFSVTAVTVGTITNNAPFTVTVTTSVAHGFNESGEIVLIKGISYPNGELLNGSFWVTPVTGQPSQFTYSVYYSPLNQYPAPPAGALTTSGVTCQKDPFLFDAVMRSLAPTNPVRVHLGPGVFETKGYQYSFRDGGLIANTGVSWKAFAGLKMRGSGLDVTTLKLVEASHRNVHYHVIGMQPNYVSALVADGFEASDFTIDCGVGSQNSTQVTCGAIFVRGSHTRLARLRAINFGRQGPGVRVQTGVLTPITPELFVFAVGGSSWMNKNGKYQSANCVIEDCVLEQPGFNNFRESTLMVVSGGEITSSTVRLIPTLGSAFRNNFFNCEHVQNPVPITGVSQVDLGVTPTKMKVTITTAQPHGLAGTPWVRVTGLVVSGSPLDGYANPYNGSYRVSNVTGDTTFEYEAVYSGALPTGVTWVGAWLNRWPSDYVKIASVSPPSPATPSALVWGTNVYQVTVTTESPHFLVELATMGVLSPGCVAVLDGTTPNSNVTPDTLNVPWFVTQWVSNTSFICQRDFEPGRTPTPGPIGVVNARLGARWQALAAASAIEGNQVHNCTVGGHYIDSYGMDPSIVRDNFYSKVRIGLTITLAVDGPSDEIAPPAIIFLSTSTTGSGSNQRWFARFEMASGLPHYLLLGQGVLIAEARKNGVLIDLYNRSSKIWAIPNPTQFEIELDSDPGAQNPDNQPTFSWLWTSAGTVFENNVVELLPALVGQGGGIQSLGFSLDGVINTAIWNKVGWLTGSRNFFRHLSFVFQNNTVRYARLPSGQPSTGNPSHEACISNRSVERGLVVDNLVDLSWRAAGDHQTPLLQLDSNLFYYFNNYSSAGLLVPGTDRSSTPAANRWEGGVNTVVEEALMLGFL